MAAITTCGECIAVVGLVAVVRGDASDDPTNPRDGGALSAENAPSFETLLHLYHKKIYNLSYRLLGDIDDAADLTQETFVKAYKAYPRFRGESSALYPWLCTIAVNGCKNRFKEMSRRNRYEVFSLDDQIDPDEPSLSLELGDDSANPAGILERKELENRIQEAVQELPPEFRVVVVLRDMFGLSYREIAEATKLSLDIVKVRLYRGRSIIRRRLLPYIGE